MNVNDTEIIWSILKARGYQHTKNIEDADIVLLVTCSIRDNAEQKVWNKLVHLNSMRNKRKQLFGSSVKIGLLGELFVNETRFLTEKLFSVNSNYFYVRLYG